MHGAEEEYVPLTMIGAGLGLVVFVLYAVPLSRTYIKVSNEW